MLTKICITTFISAFFLLATFRFTVQEPSWVNYAWEDRLIIGMGICLFLMVVSAWLGIMSAVWSW